MTRKKTFMLKKKIVPILMFIILLTAPVMTLAQGSDFDTPVPSGKLSTVITNVLNFMFGLLIALAVVFLVYGAFLYLTAAGSEEQIKKAKNTVIYAVVAVVIAVLARIIVATVSSLLGGPEQPKV